MMKQNNKKKGVTLQLPENPRPLEKLDRVPTIIMYDDNGGVGHIYGVMYYKGNTWWSNPSPPEDSFKSMRLLNVPDNFKMELYDHDRFSTNDDYCIITTKKFIGHYLINGFQNDINNEELMLKFVRRNGDLDGEISSIKLYQLIKQS